MGATSPTSDHMNCRLWIWLELFCFPLTAYVMFRSALGALANYLLLPAIPSVIVLYVLALRSWRESWVAIVGVSLLSFWLLMAVAAPYLPLVYPHKPLGTFLAPAVS